MINNKINRRFGSVCKHAKLGECLHIVIHYMYLMYKGIIK